MAQNWFKKIGKMILKSLLGGPKRKKSRRRKPGRRKPPSKKKTRPRKKKTVRRVTRKKRPPKKKKAKKPGKKSGRKKNRPRPVLTGKAGKKAQPKEIYVGRITHYFPKVNACAVQVEKREFKVGDRIHIKGSGTDFKMTVKSLQISLIPVDSGRPGEEVGLEVATRVRENDEVYLL